MFVKNDGYPWLQYLTFVLTRVYPDYFHCKRCKAKVLENIVLCQSVIIKSFTELRVVLYRRKI